MENYSKSPWPEIVFASADKAHNAKLYRAINAGELKKLLPRVYTSNLKDDQKEIIKRNRYIILSHLYPGAVISYRSAFEGGVSPKGLIVLTYKYTKKISFPGLTIRLVKGPSKQAGDTPFMQNLYLASRPRALLENLLPGRGDTTRSLGREFIEHFLDNMAKLHGDDALNRLRDQARDLAKPLGMMNEYKVLENIIGALLGTREEVLIASTAKARAAGKPYDSKRVELFATLCEALIRLSFPMKNYQHKDNDWIKNLAFFEAYFSNYIEGTEFLIEEAKEIIFEKKIITDRPEDSHDILGTYQIVSSMQEMKTLPSDFNQLVSILKARHYTLMSVRKDKLPGKFKEHANRAGNTYFVSPELVLGTLEKAFEFYHSIEQGLKRAIYIMFVISEIHPFVDGNGRISRIMMNAELVAADQSRIIIPTVYREDYLLSLRRLSRHSDPEAYIKMLSRAQAFTASIDFVEYNTALQQLINSNAFKDPDEGKLIF